MLNVIERWCAIACLALFCSFPLATGLSRAGASEVPGLITPDRSPNYAGRPTPADGWQIKKKDNGLVAQAAADAQTPDGPAKSTLSFQCTTGKGGASTIEFVVFNAVNMKGFDFYEFEGPDAPAQRHALVTLTAHRPAGDLAIRTSCTGFYTVEDEGFAFEVTTMAYVHGKVSQLSDALIHGATSISIRIRGLKHAEKTIEATFPADGAAATLGQIMAGCGKR
jgi:hypothetical protein